MSKLLFLLNLFLVLGMFQVNAQYDEFSAEDMRALEERATEVLNTYHKQIEIIADKARPKNVREHYKKSIYELFGIENKKNRNIRKNKITVEVSTLNRKNTITLTLKNYFKRLENLPYKRIEMTCTDTCNISDLNKISNHYEATLTVSCKFCGYDLDGKKRYEDITRKQIQIYIMLNKDGTLGEYWSVKLGSMKVLNTQKSNTIIL